MPITRSARFVAAAISVTLSAEVLVAITARSGSAASASRAMAVFNCIDSVTVSSSRPTCGFFSAAARSVRGQALARGAGLFLRDLGQPHPVIEDLANRRRGPLERRGLDIDQRYGVAGRDEGVGDARAHQAGAHYDHCFVAGSRGHVVVPHFSLNTGARFSRNAAAASTRSSVESSIANRSFSSRRPAPSSSSRPFRAASLTKREASGGRCAMRPASRAVPRRAPHGRHTRVTRPIR